MNTNQNNNLTCEFCNKSFTTSYNFKNHQKTAKYCLELQNKPVEEKYKCTFCNKGFNLKTIYNTHILTCKDKKDIEDKNLLGKIKELENKLKQKDKEIIKKDNLINELNIKVSLKDEIINDLKKTNKELINRPSTTSIINNDNRQQNQYNIQFNQLFEKLPILNELNINNKINELSTEEKVSQYDLDNFYKESLENITYQLKDFSFCTDPSRKMVVIKDETEKSVKMNAEEFLSKSFFLGFESITNHITLVDKIVNDRVDNYDPIITSKMLDRFNDDRDNFRKRLKNNKDNYFLTNNQTGNKIEAGVVLSCIKKLEKLTK